MSRLSLLLAAGVCLAAPAMLRARITRIAITSRTAAPQGNAYEQIRGFAFGELDPADRRNALITDIQLAPRNAAGRVEYRTTFTLLKPVDMAKSPGVMLYNVVNRGNHNGT